nr:uncharacterized protein LOC116433411 isoform X2 [Nomia melanderi]
MPETRARRAKRSLARRVGVARKLRTPGIVRSLGPRVNPLDPVLFTRTVIVPKGRMIVSLGKNSRLFRVCLALLLIGPSSCEDAANATSVESTEKIGTVLGDEKQGWTIATAKSKSATRSSWPKDSYLEALRHSRTSTDPREGLVSADGDAQQNSPKNGPASTRATSQRRREYVPGPVYVGKDYESSTSPRIVYGAPDRDSFSMVPSDSYSLPSHASGDFHGIQNSYGPPQSQPPRPAYGPPSNYPAYADYTPAGYAASHQAYGPPAPVYGNGLGHGMFESPHIVLPTVDFSWPFALKLNAFTVAKILLKLVIFKMIVKFIAVICLLLFIPKLEIKKGNKNGSNNNDDDDDEDEGRQFFDGDLRFWQRLNALTAFVSDAVDKYQALNGARSTVSDEYKSSRRPHREDWQDYAYLLRSYALEETGHSHAS